MESVWRQKAPRNLTANQKTEKLNKDTKYESDVSNITMPFYAKKRSVGVTAQEEATYKTAKETLWSDYLAWAISYELYEEVTPTQQQAEAEDGLNFQLVEVNRIRTELGMKHLLIKEKV